MSPGDSASRSGSLCGEGRGPCSLDPRQRKAWGLIRTELNIFGHPGDFKTAVLWAEGRVKLRRGCEAHLRVVGQSGITGACSI